MNAPHLPCVRQETIRTIVGAMTESERERLAKRIWRDYIAGDGYQPFGHDSATMRAVGDGPILDALLVLRTGELDGGNNFSVSYWMRQPKAPIAQ